MEKQEIEEVLGVFEGYQEKFPYTKDAFALTRLMDDVEDGTKVSDVKKGRLGRFLNLPIVRDVIAKAGDGKLSKDLFFYHAPVPSDIYVLTLDQWGNDTKYWGRGWQQMARRGFNLVVQLNLSGKHTQAIKRVDPALLEYLSTDFSCHPERTDGRITVAWSRIDMDVSSGVALIEEIQSDWVREAIDLRKRLRDMPEKKDWRDALYLRRKPQGPDQKRFWLEYLESAEFQRIEKSWSEATLEATCQFLRHEVGITEIYFYDFETGCRFKGLNDHYDRPPRSLYTNLPKRFGMERVQTVPTFLANRKDRYLKKVCQKKPAIFWRLSDQTEEADDSPPGMGPGHQRYNGRGQNLLPVYSHVILVTRSNDDNRRLH